MSADEAEIPHAAAQFVRRPRPGPASAGTPSRRTVSLAVDRLRQAVVVDARRLDREPGIEVVVDERRRQRQDGPLDAAAIGHRLTLPREIEEGRC